VKATVVVKSGVTMATTVTIVTEKIGHSENPNTSVEMKQ